MTEKEQIQRELLDSVSDARRTVASTRQYHLATCLTDLEHQFSPAGMVAALLTEQFGRVIRAHTQRLVRELDKSIKADPALNAHLADIQKDMEDVIDLVAHRIFKRHFNEAFDRVDESLKALQVYTQWLLSSGPGQQS